MRQYPEYDLVPIEQDSATANLVRELSFQSVHPLPPTERFEGAGVYVLYYCGDFPAYAPIRQDPSAPCQPIYVGKAEPSGRRTGVQGPSDADRIKLLGRLREHAGSVRAARSTLDLADFRCRFVVTRPLWIPMAERLLIAHYTPLWNSNLLPGFGLHGVGKYRFDGMIPWWDALHPGRTWAARLRQERTPAQAEQQVVRFFTASAAERERLIIPEDNTDLP